MSKETKPKKELTSVCHDQNTFNNAFMKAVDDYPKEKYNQLSQGEKTSLTIQYIVYLVLGLIFIIWAIVLAQKSKDKVLHTILAFIVAPIYVFSYYISSKR